MKLNRGHSTEVRFWSRVDKWGPNGCWLWTGKLNRDGYAQMNAYGQKGMGAHRVSYVMNVGPIPEGLQLDHLCRVRHCVNPAHLEPVTNEENMRRGIVHERRGAHERAKTHCKQGHEFTPESVVNRKRGGRDCKECHRLREERKRRAAGIQPRPGTKES